MTPHFSWVSWVQTCGVVALILVAINGELAVPQTVEEFDDEYLAWSTDDIPNLSAAENIIQRETNALREGEGLARLQTDPRLAETARYFASYMARTGEYGHQADGNRPSERASMFGYDYCLVAENIAKQFDSTGFTAEELGRDFFEGWRDSPPHRKNMLDAAVSETGVAIAHNPDSGRYYAVQLFGRPKSAAVRFQIANHSEKDIRYSVAAVGADPTTAKEFRLPPLATRTHLRCRVPVVDWQWTDRFDRLAVDGGTRFVISSGSDGTTQLSIRAVATTDLNNTKGEQSWKPQVESELID